MELQEAMFLRPEIDEVIKLTGQLKIHWETYDLPKDLVINGITLMSDKLVDFAKRVEAIKGILPEKRRIEDCNCYSCKIDTGSCVTALRNLIIDDCALAIAKNLPTVEEIEHILKNTEVFLNL